jgi:hypothetical protein
LAGWVLAGIILVIWFVPGPLFEKFLATAGTRIKNIIAAAAALLMNSVYPQGTNVSALFLGFCLGYNMMKSRFPFYAREEINGKRPGIKVMIFRCITGFAGMAVIFLVSGLIFPGEGSLFSDFPLWDSSSNFYDLGRFLRYGLLGIWASAGAPLVFQRMKLAPEPTVDGEGPASKMPGSPSGKNPE